MAYQLVIFDMDGTLLYTLQDLSDGLNYALRKNGYPQKSPQEVRSYVGNGIRNEVRCSLPKDTDPIIQEKVYEDFRDYYGQHCRDHTKPYDGILSLLQQLKENHVFTAVVSNKGDAEVQQLDHQYFEGLLNIGVGEKEGIARKPAPDTVNKVLNELSVDRKNAVYVGDSEVDIQTARNACMKCIIVDWGYRDHDFLVKEGAETIVSTPQELLNHLLKQH